MFGLLRSVIGWTTTGSVIGGAFAREDTAGVIFVSERGAASEKFSTPGFGFDSLRSLRGAGFWDSST